MEYLDVEWKGNRNEQKRQDVQDVQGRLDAEVCLSGAFLHSHIHTSRVHLIELSSAPSVPLQHLPTSVEHLIASQYQTKNKD